MSSPSRLYLGFDSSTQQLKAIVIDENLQTVAEEAINFNDRAILQHHVQPNGFVVDREDPRCITTSVFVFLEALGKTNDFLRCLNEHSIDLPDVLFRKLREQNKFNLADVVAISGRSICIATLISIEHVQAVVNSTAASIGKAERLWIK